MYTIVIIIIIHNIIQAAMIQADAILSTFTLLFPACYVVVVLFIFSTIEYSLYDVVHAMML